MVTIIMYGIGMIIYIFLPIPIQAIMFVLNLVVPDPLPMIDEVVSLVIMIKRVKKLIGKNGFVSKLKEECIKTPVIVAIVVLILGIIIFI